MWKIFNSLETSARILTELNMDINCYGTLLVSFILERIHSELKVIILRRFKDDVYYLLNLIELFQEELSARERLKQLMTRKIVLKTKIFSLLKLCQITLAKIVVLKGLKEKNKFLFIVKVRTTFLQDMVI